MRQRRQQASTLHSLLHKFMQNSLSVDYIDANYKTMILTLKSPEGDQDIQPLKQKTN